MVDALARIYAEVTKGWRRQLYREFSLQMSFEELTGFSEFHNIN